MASVLRHIAKEAVCSAPGGWGAAGIPWQRSPGGAGGDGRYGQWSCMVLAAAATTAAIVLGWQPLVWTGGWRFY